MIGNRPLIAAAVLSAAVSCAQAAEIEAGGLYDLPPADVVILGEIHDNPVHHAHQAIAVEAVGAKALVFEMLTADEALKVRPGLGEAALEAVLDWDDSGWPDFAMYYPIFVAAGDVPVFGGGLDRDVVRQATHVGAAEAFGTGAAVFGLDRALSDDEQAEREADQMEAHCNALPEELLFGMVEAQRLRDAALAQAVMAALAETGGPVAVITGNGHARRDRGIPQALALAAPDVSVLTVGQFEEQAPDDPPFDLWLVTEAAERPDPCAAFRDR